MKLTTDRLTMKDAAAITRRIAGTGGMIAADAYARVSADADAGTVTVTRTNGDTVAEATCRSSGYSLALRSGYSSLSRAPCACCRGPPPVVVVGWHG